MNLRFRLFCVLFGVSTFALAQILTPAKWGTPAFNKTALVVGQEVDLVFTATLDKDWYLYSSEFPCEDGPIKTSILFEKHPSYEAVGPLVAINPTDKHDEIFDCDVKIFKTRAEFRQRIRIKQPALVIKGEYDYQVCTEVDGRCIPGNDDFSITATAQEGAARTQPDTQTQPSNETGAAQTTLADTLPAVQPASVVSSAIQGPILSEDLRNATPSQSLWGFMLIAFLAGLAALLTPCVFPMIPMTVSFFTGEGRSRFQALVYGVSIVAIYTVVGAALAPLMGPETANHLSTEWLPNIIFFAVFVVFGLSFLGWFEIALPGTFINKVDQQAEKGGLTGVFFMAFTLVLVSFSCTGPIVGSLLVSSAWGEFLKPIAGMFAFSLAFAIPFTLFAFFPGWMKSLPKSGGWLNTVKVLLGFVELALAFKFLSIADQAFHWGILDREINIAIWIVIGLLMGLYLLKIYRLPGDTGKEAEDPRVSVPRLALAVALLTFVVYLIPGMWGAPLKALAGYLPPMYTHDFAPQANAGGGTLCEAPKYADFLHLPHGLKGYFDYEQAVRCARSQNKPIFIDFTGHGCTNCREMEAVVWSDPRVLERLRNDYVIVALYVDDKTELPETAWYTSDYDNKIKKTIGKQNADLQIRRLQNNAQPFYVLMHPDETVLVAPYGYNKDADAFVRFLDEGKRAFAGKS
jgi:thiol:disulfide interchange protein DsbD